LQRKNTDGGLKAFTSTAFLSRRSSSGFQGVIGASAPIFGPLSLSLSEARSLSEKVATHGTMLEEKERGTENKKDNRTEKNKKRRGI
jgi:hypothetical protein